MADRTESRRNSKKTKTNSYKEWEVVESHHHPRPKRTLHMKVRKKSKRCPYLRTEFVKPTSFHK